jgi:hypothetical protein
VLEVYENMEEQEMTDNIQCGITPEIAKARSDKVREEAIKAFDKWVENVAIPEACFELNGFVGGFKAGQASRNELLRECLLAISYMMEDMRKRIDNDAISEAVQQFNALPSCSGEKNEDGSYTLPMSQSTVSRLVAVTAKLKEALNDTDS